MQKRTKRFRKAICLILGCICLLLAYGCSPAKEASSAGETSASSETTTDTSTTQAQPETSSGADMGESKTESVMGADLIVQHMDGIDVISNRVERVSSGMTYTPNPGEGYFTVNGTITGDSEIVISINPVSVLRFKVSLRSDTAKTVHAEVRMLKEGKLLVSCEQENMELQEGINDIDVGIDTGEGDGCKGTYNLYLYFDGVLVSEGEKVL